MDHVFGAFPDDKPQEKKNLGQWQGVVEYAGGEPWSQPQSRSGLM